MAVFNIRSEEKNDLHDKICCNDSRDLLKYGMAQMTVFNIRSVEKNDLHDKICCNDSRDLLKYGMARWLSSTSGLRRKMIYTIRFAATIAETSWNTVWPDDCLQHQVCGDVEKNDLHDKICCNDSRDILK